MLIFFFILWGHFWQFHIRYTTKNQALRNSVSTALHTWLVRLVPVIKHSSPWFATLTNINNFKTHQPSTPTALLQSFARSANNKNIYNKNLFSVYYKIHVIFRSNYIIRNIWIIIWKSKRTFWFCFFWIVFKLISKKILVNSNYFKS